MDLFLFHGQAHQDQPLAPQRFPHYLTCGSIPFLKIMTSGFLRIVGYAETSFCLKHYRDRLHPESSPPPLFYIPRGCRTLFYFLLQAGLLVWSLPALLRQSFSQGPRWTRKKMACSTKAQKRYGTPQMTTNEPSPSPTSTPLILPSGTSGSKLTSSLLLWTR